ncbi:MAG: Zn-dependent hydrolase [Spirochaetes bacterium]|nr:MAG: Zn-dependent hydrolase [Spirochaetota bacterium]
MKIYQHYSIYGFSNTYIVGNEATSQALIIDPSELTISMIDQIQHNRYELTAILITHNHIHHTRGVKTLMRIYQPQVYASNMRIYDIACRKVRDRDEFQESGFSISAIAVPGHSQDSIVYKIGASLFTGDALHAGVIGRTTSAFNAQALSERIGEKLLCYPEDSLVFPGHGPPSTLGTEKKFNLGLQPGYAKRLAKPYDFFV